MQGYFFVYKASVSTTMCLAQEKVAWQKLVPYSFFASQRDLASSTFCLTGYEIGPKPKAGSWPSCMPINVLLKIDFIRLSSHHN